MASFVGKAFYVASFAVAVILIRRYNAGGWCHSDARLEGKVSIVTGANTGIGYETALDLARRGSKVIMACRSVRRCDDAAATIRQAEGVQAALVKTMTLDLASLQSVRDFAENFKRSESSLHILVNNAGLIGFPERRLTADGFEETFGVNHLGHFLLTNLLIDTLKASVPSRVLTVTGHAYTFGSLNLTDLQSEENYGGVKAYIASKIANILFSRELAKKLKGTGVTTYTLHPGVIITEIQKNFPGYHVPVVRELIYGLTWPFLKNAQEGAQTSICCAVDESLATETGKYYCDCAEYPLNDAAMDDDAALELWKISERLVGLN